MLQILKRLRNRMLRDIYQMGVFRVRSEFAYQKAVNKNTYNIPVISPGEFAMVDALRREGIFVTSLEQLGIPSTSRLLHASQSLLPKILTTSVSSKKEFMIKATSNQLMEYPELFLWGLEPKLLKIIENYLSLPIAYHGLYFRRDLANGIQRKSRLWHIDMEDRQMFKIIIYLNDVSDDSGPFQYIPRGLTSSISRLLKYKYGYIKDKTMEKVVPRSEWKSCPGAAGTIIFADTANIFHRGKVPVSSERLSIFFDYTSRIPKHPFYCKSSFSLNELMILAKMLDKRQQKCIFWSQKLLQDDQQKLA